MNSPEGTLFRKGEVLYGLTSRARRSRGRPRVVVEGYTDVLALHQAGYESVWPRWAPR